MLYELSTAAEEDIIQIYLDGADRFAVAQAERYHAELKRVFGLIGDHPRIGREHANFSPPVRIHPHGSHLVIYTVTDDGVTIVRVVSARQDWRAILGGEE